MNPQAQKGNKIGSVRRSHRVYLNVEISVVGETSERKLLSEETRTVVVNAHGASILLQSKVRMGQLLRLKNLMTQEELFCRVAHIGPIRSGIGITEVGIEFMQPTPRFWHIAYMPVDWTPRNPEVADGVETDQSVSRIQV